MGEEPELEGERLYDALMAIKPQRLTETDWAIGAGVNRGWFGNLKTKSKNPRRDTLRRVLAYVQKSEADLRNDAPPAQRVHGRFVGEVPDVPPIRTASQNDGAIEIRALDLNYGMGPGKNPDTDFPESTPVLFDPNFLRTLTHAAPDQLFVARGDGDSMFPTLINDDQVMIDMSQRVLNMQDRLWAISVHGAGMIKRLRTAGKGKVRILSDNPTVPPDEVDAEDLFIVGRVVWVGRRV